MQFVLAAVYLPLASRREHKFGVSRLRRAVSSRALSVALARAEAGLFYAVFLALSAAVVQLNVTNYRINNVLLSQPERYSIERLRRERARLLEEQRHPRAVPEKSMATVRLEDAARRPKTRRGSEVVVPLD